MPFVEMVAVIAKYIPLAEKAGMQKISEQPPAKEALAIAQVLSELGFNIQLLGSEKYVLNKLRTLKLEDVTRIKDAFICNKAPRFMRYFLATSLMENRNFIARNSLKLAWKGLHV